jgi:hypothetical protein
MPFVFLADMRFSGIVWVLTFLPSRRTETNIWHGRPFAGKFADQRKMIKRK